MDDLFTISPVNLLFTSSLITLLICVAIVLWLVT